MAKQRRKKFGPKNKNPTAGVVLAVGI